MDIVALQTFTKAISPNIVLILIISYFGSQLATWANESSQDQYLVNMAKHYFTAQGTYFLEE